ncbi:MAG TPA: type II secretion system protein GspM [Ramlibacter sp.]|nr:type II secretion system protein GspM [Ramlibacter sp.]
MNAAAPVNDRMAALRQRWRAMPAREKTLAAIAAGLVFAALLWWIAILPALSTLRTSAAQHQLLDAQLRRMRALAGQAQALQAQPRQNPDDAARALEASVTQILGTTGRVVMAGDRATITLNGARPEALTQWLAQARVNAHAVPAEARVQRNANGLWDGSIAMGLPAR